MKRKLNILFVIAFIVLSSTSVFADDLSPADVYYKENIAVTDVSAKAPVLRAPGDDDDDLVTPPQGGTGGGPWVGAPIGNAVLPVIAVGVVYAILMSRRSKRRI